MNIAFTTTGPDWDSPMDPRFGRTRFLLVLNEESGEIKTFDNAEIQEAAHGAGPRTAQKLQELGAEVLVTGNGPGGNAFVLLEKTGIRIYAGAGEMTAQKALEAYRSGSLKEFQPG